MHISIGLGVMTVVDSNSFTTELGWAPPPL